MANLQQHCCPPMSCGSEVDSSQLAIEKLLADDAAMVALANKKRVELFESPSQSEFRVFAILAVLSEGKLSLVEGANSEQGYIGGAICAERSALVKLRFFNKPQIKHVTVVTDSVSPLSPGALCREYLMSHCNLDTVLVMGNSTGDKISRCVVADLWPHPYQYRKLRRGDIIPFAEAFSARMKKADGLKASNPSAEQVYRKACGAIKVNTNASIHPLQFAAALLFDDGTVETAHQMNGIEYGCTLDSVSQLIREIERRQYCQPCGSSTVVKPVTLVMVDQFGVAHGPFAAARSLLSEHGYGYIEVLIHDSNTGEFVTQTIDELIPQVKDSHLLSCSDFH